jgi:transcriptional regulator with XRE-family HTH domain
MNEIVKRLKLYRLQLGYSQQKLAEHLNISQSAYAKIEKGITRLDLERLEQICEILRVSPSDLIQDIKSFRSVGQNQPGEMIRQQTIQHLMEEIKFLRQLLSERQD